MVGKVRLENRSSSVCCLWQQAAVVILFALWVYTKSSARKKQSRTPPTTKKTYSYRDWTSDGMKIESDLFGFLVERNLSAHVKIERELFNFSVSFPIFRFSFSLN
eukprot:c8521_g1_i5.p1 GENE.c8521_g1_i5~~c8521_g1_i5.p1  ORF type:complete len:105 (+),score=7.61 c8521_g1_i5:37-351(+)